MSTPPPPARPARPQIELNRGELGLCVWALGLLSANLEDDHGTDLILSDIDHLRRRLREHVYAVDDWQNNGQAVGAGEESPV